MVCLVEFPDLIIMGITGRLIWSAYRAPLGGGFISNWNLVLLGRNLRLTQRSARGQVAPPFSPRHHGIRPIYGGHRRGVIHTRAIYACHSSGPVTNMGRPNSGAVAHFHITDAAAETDSPRNGVSEPLHLSDPTQSRVDWRVCRFTCGRRRRELFRRPRRPNWAGWRSRPGLFRSCWAIAFRRRYARKRCNSGSRP